MYFSHVILFVFWLTDHDEVEPDGDGLYTNLTEKAWPNREQLDFQTVSTKTAMYTVGSNPTHRQV